LDNWLKEKLWKYVSEEQNWLNSCFEKILEIDKHRRNDNADSSFFGFETIIQISLSCWLISQNEIESVHINKKHKITPKYCKLLPKIVILACTCPINSSSILPDVKKQKPILLLSTKSFDKHIIQK